MCAHKTFISLHSQIVLPNVYLDHELTTVYTSLGPTDSTLWKARKGRLGESRT